MDEDGVGYSTAGLVAQMRTQGNIWKQGPITIKLAKAYGYCWGVERAVRMAYEARQTNPDKKMFITNEIIHNPEVNDVSEGRRGCCNGSATGPCCMVVAVSDWIDGVMRQALAWDGQPTCMCPMPGARDACSSVHG